MTILEYDIDNMTEFNEIKPHTYVAFARDSIWSFGLADKCMKDGKWRIITYEGIYRIAPNNVDDLIWLDKNPFKSEAQRRYMWINHPEIAEAWSHGHHTSHRSNSSIHAGRRRLHK